MKLHEMAGMALSKNKPRYGYHWTRLTGISLRENKIKAMAFITSWYAQ